MKKETNNRKREGKKAKKAVEDKRLITELAKLGETEAIRCLLLRNPPPPTDLGF